MQFNAVAILYFIDALPESLQLVAEINFTVQVSDTTKLNSSNAAPANKLISYLVLQYSRRIEQIGKAAGETDCFSVAGKLRI